MLDVHMTYETVEHPSHPRPMLPSGRLAILVQRLLDWHERVQQRRHLGALSAHMLKDIGLTSADVYAELGKRPWQL